MAVLALVATVGAPKGGIMFRPEVFHGSRGGMLWEDLCGLCLEVGFCGVRNLGTRSFSSSLM